MKLGDQVLLPLPLKRSDEDMKRKEENGWMEDMKKKKEENSCTESHGLVLSMILALILKIHLFLFAFVHHHLPLKVVSTSGILTVTNWGVSNASIPQYPGATFTGVHMLGPADAFNPASGVFTAPVAVWNEFA